MRYIALFLMIALSAAMSHQSLCFKNPLTKEGKAASISVLDVCSKDAPFTSSVNADTPPAVYECSCMDGAIKSHDTYPVVERQFIRFIIAFNKEYPPEV